MSYGVISVVFNKKLLDTEWLGAWFPQFFKPLNPVNVVIHYNNDGRASGEADVDFTTHDEAQSAMTKDRAVMSTSGFNSTNNFEFQFGGWVGAMLPLGYQADLKKRKL